MKNSKDGLNYKLIRVIEMLNNNQIVINEKFSNTIEKYELIAQETQNKEAIKKIEYISENIEFFQSNLILSFLE